MVYDIGIHGFYKFAPMVDLIAEEQRGPARAVDKYTQLFTSMLEEARRRMYRAIATIMRPSCRERLRMVAQAVS